MDTSQPEDHMLSNYIPQSRVHMLNTERLLIYLEAATNVNVPYSSDLQ